MGSVRVVASARLTMRSIMDTDTRLFCLMGVLGGQGGVFPWVMCPEEVFGLFVFCFLGWSFRSHFLRFVDGWMDGRR